jgi:hypothetical protein
MTLEFKIDNVECSFVDIVNYKSPAFWVVICGFIAAIILIIYGKSTGWVDPINNGYYAISVVVLVLQ